MRKYFLLSAVAALAASTANATTDYAEVTARATIQVAGTLDCESSIDWGTIVVKQGHGDITIASDDADLPDGILSMPYAGGIMAFCGYGEDDAIQFQPTTVTLAKKDGGEGILTYKPEYSGGHESIVGTLTIPAGTVSGDYEGSFTAVRTY